MRPVIFSADLHLTSQQPRYRTDDYAMACLGKLEFILATAAKYNSTVTFAGDIFDKATGPFWFLNAVLQQFMIQGGDCFCVAGNHDQNFHNPDLSRTQLGNLIINDVLKVVHHGEARDGAVFFGRSWGQDYPPPPKGHRDIPHILVAHETVTKGEPPPWLTALSAEQMIEAHPGYDYIVTGDFHEKFVVTHNGCTLINTGPLMRASVDKRDFQPSIWMISDAGVTEIPVPVNQDVFNVEALDDVTRAKDSAFDMQLMEKFIGSLDFAKDRPTFGQIVTSALAELGPDKAELKSTIEEIMDYVRADS